jgi:hypothetical protein
MSVVLTGEMGFDTQHGKRFFSSVLCLDELCMDRTQLAINCHSDRGQLSTPLRLM